MTDKIVWLTDVHITPSGLINDQPSTARLERAVAEILRWHSDAAACVISGDLTENGTAEEYAVAAGILADLPMPVLPMAGNHDDRASLRGALALPDGAMPGFVQYRVDVGAVTLLCLDTQVPHKPYGRLCAERLDWLGRALTGTEGRAVLVFLHHPPCRLGLGPLDDICLRHPETFLDMIAGRADHLFCGHVHRPTAGTIRGIPFATQRALAYQAPRPFPPWTWATFEPANEQPQYGVILADAGRIVLQTFDLPGD